MSLEVVLSSSLEVVLLICFDAFSLDSFRGCITEVTGRLVQ